MDFIYLRIFRRAKLIKLLETCTICCDISFWFAKSGQSTERHQPSQFKMAWRLVVCNLVNFWHWIFRRFRITITRFPEIFKPMTDHFFAFGIWNCCQCYVCALQSGRVWKKKSINNGKSMFNPSNRELELNTHSCSSSKLFGMFSSKQQQNKSNAV